MSSPIRYTPPGVDQLRRQFEAPQTASPGKAPAVSKGEIGKLRSRFEPIQADTASPVVAKVAGQQGKIDQVRTSQNGSPTIHAEKGIDTNPLVGKTFEKRIRTPSPEKPIVQKYLESVTREAKPSQNLDGAASLSTKISSLSSDLKSGRIKPEEFHAKVKGLSNEIAELSFHSAFSPGVQAKVTQLHSQLKEIAKSDPNLLKIVESQAKASLSMVKAFEKGGVMVHPKENLSTFLSRNGVTKEDIAQEAKFFDLTDKTAEMKAAKRTAILLQGENKTGRTGSFTKTAAELGVTPTTIKAAYKMYKENVRNNEQGAPSTGDKSATLEDKKFTLLSSEKEVFLQSKQLGAGSFKATYVLQTIYGDSNPDLVSQNPKEKVAKAPKEPKPEPLPDMGTSVFSGVKSEDYEVTVDFREFVLEGMPYGQLVEYKEFLEKENSPTHSTELFQVKARIQQTEVFLYWAQENEPLTQITEKEAYSREIEMQRGLKGDHIESLHKVISVQGKDGEVTKTIIKERAGLTLPPNEFRKEELKVHDLQGLADAIEDGEASPQEFLMGMQCIHDSMQGLKELKEQSSLQGSQGNESRYIFRDLKPANILIDPKGKAKLTDFGALVKSQEDPFITKYQGTIPFSSPEQASIPRNPEFSLDMNEQSDVWSMGMLMHDMLVDGGPQSHPVWHGVDFDPEILENVYQKKTGRDQYNSDSQKYVEAAPNDLAKDVRQLIIDCTQVAPKDRITIEEASNRFQGILERAKKEPEKLYDPSQERALVG